MPIESINKRFLSEQYADDYDPSVSLRLHAYFTDGSIFDEYTLSFDCDPIGTNYDRTMLQVTFLSWEPIREIREFLRSHFEDPIDAERSMTIPVAKGDCWLSPANSTPREKDDIEELRIRAVDNRIEFGSCFNMNPYIYAYRTESEAGRTDERNLKELLDFFGEIIERSSITQSADGPSGDGLLTHVFDPETASENLTRFPNSEQIAEPFEDGVVDLQNGEYSDCIRDIGLSAEELLERLTKRIYDDGDIPSNVGGKVNKLSNTESGVPSYISKSLDSIWWLRNKVSHPTEYDVSRSDAEYALVSFQIAIERYVEEYLDENTS